jgi:hypothetical protein
VEESAYREAAIAVDWQRDDGVIRDDWLRKEDADAAADKDGRDHGSNSSSGSSVDG